VVKVSKLSFSKLHTTYRLRWCIHNYILYVKVQLDNFDTLTIIVYNIKYTKYK